MSSAAVIDFDVGNYTVYEIFDMFKLDSATCNMQEADACANQLATALIQHQDAAHFIHQCREKIRQFIQSRVKPYHQSIVSQNNDYRPNANEARSEKNTINLNYSTHPSNYDAFYRESELHDGGSSTYAKRNIAPVTNTHNYKFPTGVLNPIERRVIKRLLSMDTLFRV
ncbi:MAG: hypothetical protein EBY22_17575, partial [Gammaproteobacteria bacterium]|nr:hypothetical protein [Gammaproteobacteria bacterium]